MLYYYGPNDAGSAHKEDSKKLAKYIYKAVLYADPWYAAGDRNEDGRVYYNPNDKKAFTRYTRVPSVIYENGFLSNRQDALNAADYSIRDARARGVARGIRHYQLEW